MSFDDVPEWLRLHHELYGDGEEVAKRSVPQWDGGKDNPQLDALRFSAEVEATIDALIEDVRQLHHYYATRILEEWQPGADPWLR
jgi:hypothetical protein